MRAVLCRTLGSVDNLNVENVPSPALGKGQVRIGVKAAGVNFPDILMVEGKYQVKPELPFIPGLEVAGVVQPAHGLTPSAAELRDMVKLLQREKIRVVFSEDTFPPPLLKVLTDEAGVKVYVISHIASGMYTADKFEREMQKNVDTMVRALVTEP